MDLQEFIRKYEDNDCSILDLTKDLVQYNSPKITKWLREEGTAKSLYALGCILIKNYLSDGIITLYKAIELDQDYLPAYRRLIHYHACISWRDNVVNKLPKLDLKYALKIINEEIYTEDCYKYIAMYHYTNGNYVESAKCYIKYRNLCKYVSNYCDELDLILSKLKENNVGIGDLLSIFSEGDRNNNEPLKLFYTMYDEIERLREENEFFSQWSVIDACDKKVQ